jgi:FG-GAP repeat
MGSRVSWISHLLVAVFSSLPLISGAAPSGIIDLSDVGVGEVPGVRLNGIDWMDRMGLKVSGAGDVNADGLEDFLLSAVLGDPGGRGAAGEVYLIFGGTNGLGVSGEFDLENIDGLNGVRIDGLATMDQIGIDLCCLGDFNGDTVADFALSTWRADPGGRTEAGSTFVIYGGTDRFSAGTPLDLSQLDGSNGFRINGILANDDSGLFLSGAGDVNGDGFRDLLIGAARAETILSDRPGESYLIYGTSAVIPGGVLELSSLDGSNGVRFVGTQIGDFACSVAGLHDVNGDGFDDFAIGARAIDVSAEIDTGVVYLIHGTNEEIGDSGLFSLGSLGSPEGVLIQGAEEGDLTGHTVNGAGDFNGDGIGDLLIGAPYSQANGLYRSGVTYLLWGSPNGIGGDGFLDLAELTVEQGIRIDGILEEDLAGFWVREAGDVNADGLSDIILGSTKADPRSMEDAGEAYLIYGSRVEIGESGVLNLADLDGFNGLRFQGEAAGDCAGRSVSGAGDVNGDGRQDLLIGSYRADSGPVDDTGRAHLVFGGSLRHETLYSSHLPSLSTPLSGVGYVGTNISSIPPSRCSLRFVDGVGPGNSGASRQRAAYGSPDLGVFNLGPRETLTDITWAADTDREGWTGVELVLHYLDSEIEGFDESRLCVYQGPLPHGPWRHVSDAQIDPDRNDVHVTSDRLGIFVLAEAPDADAITGEMMLQVLLGQRPPHPAYNRNGDDAVDIADLAALLEEGP